MVRGLIPEDSLKITMQQPAAVIQRCAISTLYHSTLAVLSALCTNSSQVPGLLLKLPVVSTNGL